MLKRALMTLAFVSAVAVGSLGFTSNAEARHRHCGGGWHGGHYPHYRSHFGPRYSTYYHRYGGHRGHRHHDYYYGRPRSGVSFYIGF